MNKEYRQRRTAIPAIILAAGAIGLSSYQLGLQESDPSAKIEAVRVDAQKADATREAERLSSELGRAGKDVSAELTTWSGVIARKTKEGTVYIGNPIVLTRGDTAEPVPTTNEASPSYYGVIESPDGKNFIIKPYAFTESDTFTPYDNDNTGLLTVETYMSSVNPTSNGEAYYQAFAFDPAGEQQVLNPNGSLLSPGLILPQDRK